MKSNKNLLAITATAIVSLGLIASWVVGFELGSKKIAQANNTGDANTNAQTTSVDNVYVDEAQKYSQSGVITQIDNDTIFIQGQTIKDGELATETYAILTDANTIFKKFNLADNPTQNNEIIKISDLKKDDTVTALSDENIKDKTQFTARQINLYITNN